MTAAPMADLMRLAEWAIRAWRGHSEYDDMLQESYLAAWTGWHKAQAKGARSARAYATRCASRGPFVWLKKWQGRPESWRARSEAVSLDVLANVGGQRFEDRLLDHLERAALRHRVWAECTPEERTVLYRLFWLEESQVEAARALSLSPRQVWCRYHALLKAARAALGGMR